MGVVESPRKGWSEMLKAGVTQNFQNLVLTSPPKRHSSQPEIPLTEESFSDGVMVKTEYLGNARGLTLHRGVNGMHLILPWKGQRAEVMRVMRA